MPNWCHNELTVSGDPDKVTAFVEKVRTADKPLTFAAHVPEPAEGSHWVGWREEHWGTKSNAEIEALMAIGTEVAIAALDAATTSLDWVSTDGGLQLKFHTAWQPPHVWLKAVAEQEPELRFVLRFAEPGGEFAGEIRAQGAELTAQELAVDEVLSEEEMWF